MRKGKVIIEYESDDSGKCNFKISQEGKEKLDDDNIIFLFEHVLRELMPNDLQFQ